MSRVAVFIDWAGQFNSPRSAIDRSIGVVQAMSSGGSSVQQLVFLLGDSSGPPPRSLSADPPSAFLMRCVCALAIEEALIRRGRKALVSSESPVEGLIGVSNYLEIGRAVSTGWIPVLVEPPNIAVVRHHDWAERWIKLLACEWLMSPGDCVLKGRTSYFDSSSLETLQASLADAERALEQGDT